MSRRLSRRRSATALTAALAPVLALLVACGSSSAPTTAANAAAGAKPTLPLAFFQGTVAGPETIVAANAQLADKLPVTLKLVPIDSGVAGIAQLKGGAFPGISAVGNPPTVAAIGKGTDVTVVWVESQDSAALVVDGTIGDLNALAGQKVGALVGSTLDFQLRGLLATKGLTDSVQVTGFPSEAAEVAAFKSGQLHAAYLSIGNVVQLLKRPGTKRLAESADIARQGYATLGLLVVTGDYIAKHRDVVQKLVCGVKQAQDLLAGPDAATYITPAAGLLGADADAVIAGTKGYPYIKDADQLAWFTGADGTVASGALAKNFALVGRFLVDQQRLDAVPSADVIARHIDPSFARQALRAGGCT